MNPYGAAAKAFAFARTGNRPMASSSDQALAPTTTAARTSLLARAGHWVLLRILVQAAALVIVVAVMSRLLGLVIPPPGAAGHAEWATVRNLVDAALLLGVYGLTIGWMEQRTPVEIGPRAGAVQFPGGVVIGATMMAAVYAVLAGMGLASFGPGTGLQGLGVGLASALMAGVFEELLLRAVLFRNLEQAFGTTIALVVSAAVFGLLHSFNPGATAFSDAAIALEAGLLLALAYAVTRNLWLAIGLHAGWNFTEGSVFGAQVSGGAAGRSLIHSTLTGPSLLTGGSFGPEASVVAIGVSACVALVFAVLIIRGGGWRPLSFRLSIP